MLWAGSLWTIEHDYYYYYCYWSWESPNQVTSSWGTSPGSFKEDTNLICKGGASGPSYLLQAPLDSITFGIKFQWRNIGVDTKLRSLNFEARLHWPVIIQWIKFNTKCSWWERLMRGHWHHPQLGTSEAHTYRHTEANVSSRNTPAAHLATLSQGKEEEFFVKREREGAKNEVFLNLSISTKREEEAMLLR